MTMQWSSWGKRGQRSGTPSISPGCKQYPVVAGAATLGEDDTRRNRIANSLGIHTTALNGSDHPMFQCCQHRDSCVDANQILLQPMPILTREHCVQHILRVCNNVYQAQHLSVVAVNINKQTGLGCVGTRKKREVMYTQVCVYALRQGALCVRC